MYNSYREYRPEALQNYHNPRRAQPYNSFSPRNKIFPNYGTEPHMTTHNQQSTATTASKEESKIGFIEGFCEDTTIHGIKFAMNANATKFERYLWRLILLLTSITLFITFGIFYLNDQGDLTTLIKNASYSITDIPFPGVTFCPRTSFNWTRYRDAERKFLPQNASSAMRSLFKQFLIYFNDFPFRNQPIHNRPKHEFSVVPADLKQLDSINVREVFDFLALTCEESLDKCSWSGMEQSCCKIFTRQYTEKGSCFTFNAAPANTDPKQGAVENVKLYRSQMKGAQGSLQTEKSLPRKENFMAKRYESNFSAEFLLNGMQCILVLIHDPYDSPQSDTTMVGDGAHGNFYITPKKFSSKMETKSIPSPVRQCLFEFETEDILYSTLPGYDYSLSNCIMECKRKYIFKMCKCIPEVFYLAGNYPACKPSEYLCFREIVESLNNVIKLSSHSNQSNSITCYCMGNCNRVSYGLTTSIALGSPPFNRYQMQDDYIRLSVQYEVETFIRYETFLSKTWFDYLVYYGGIASFFLGCSVLSFIEVIYYFSIRLAVHLGTKAKNHFN